MDLILKLPTLILYTGLNVSSSSSYNFYSHEEHKASLYSFHAIIKDPYIPRSQLNTGELYIFNSNIYICQMCDVTRRFTEKNYLQIYGTIYIWYICGQYIFLALIYYIFGTKIYKKEK